MEVANIESFLAQLLALRDSWKAVWKEAKLVASSLQIEVNLSRHRSTTARERTRFHDEDTPGENVNEEANLRKHIFYIVLDDVIRWLTVRFSAEKHISDTISFQWNYQKMLIEELKHKAAKLAEKYSKDISSEDLV